MSDEALEILGMFMILRKRKTTPREWEELAAMMGEFQGPLNESVGESGPIIEQPSLFAEAL